MHLGSELHALGATRNGGVPLGPVVISDGRVVPNPTRPGSFLSQALLLEALAELAPRASTRVLDVGCGTKPYKSFLGTQASIYVGCDWPPNPGSSDGHAADVFADAMSLPFAANAFGCVLCTEVLEHLPEPWRCVSELARVLEPGGELLLSVPFLYWLHEQPRDFFRYTPHGITGMLARVGLEVRETRKRGGVFAVVLDLSGKWVIFASRRVARKLPGGQGLTKVVGTMVRWGYQAFLGIRSAARSARPLRGVASALSMDDMVTLGYVVRATKVAPDATQTESRAPSTADNCQP